MKQVVATPTYSRRDRVVTPDGLGHIVHDFGFGMYNIKMSNGEKKVELKEVLRPAKSKDFKKGKAEIYKNPTTKKWDFRLIQKNGNVIGGSRQGYSNRVDMIDVLNNNYIDFEIVQK